MNILLIYPQYPDTYWSFKHALPFISKKAAVPPLGLITVSAMLPSFWNKKLIDLNVDNLSSSDFDWADFVFISAMYVQKKSVNNILAQCTNQKAKIIAGGPLFTQEYKNYPQVDYFILNEAEITLPIFLDDLFSKRKIKRIYKTDKYADITKSPIPDYHLLSMKKYALMNLQVSRGCPFACDFCEITTLLGHRVRMKEPEQIINELEALYQLNWRGTVSIVDDNFIGQKKEVKTRLLPEIYNWMQSHKFPFTFNTQTSINLADDDELLSFMVKSNFDSTFIGIETPDETSLEQCNKVQNKNRDLLASVKKIQKAGMTVSGGFIVGFDSDSSSVFHRQINFIKQSGIVSAMVGLLNAPKNTKLYERLKKENRLTVEASGNNTDATMNFIPKMNVSEVLEGYQNIIENIYSVKPYYKRIKQFFLNYTKQNKNTAKLSLSHFSAFLKSIIIIGVLNKGRGEYWKFLAWTIFYRPSLFKNAITFSVYGYHYRAVYGLK